MTVKCIIYILALLAFSVIGVNWQAYGLDDPAYEGLFQKHDGDFSAGHLEQFYIDSGLKSFSGSDYDNAIRYFNIALSFNNNNPVPWQYIGVISFHRGMHEDALNMLRKSLDLYQDSYGTNLYMARTFEALNKIDDALVYYKKAVYLNPKSKYAYARIFELYRMRLEPLSIIQYGKSVLGLKQPQDVASYVYMWVAYAYLYIGDYEHAIANLSHSKDLKKNNTPDYLWVSGLIDILSARKHYRHDNDAALLDDMNKILIQIAGI
jgi:tetratricopeptide (TPR) repeat protein